MAIIHTLTLVESFTDGVNFVALRLTIKATDNADSDPATNNFSVKVKEDITPVAALTQTIVTASQVSILATESVIPGTNNESYMNGVIIEQQNLKIITSATVVDFGALPP